MKTFGDTPRAQRLADYIEWKMRQPFCEPDGALAPDMFVLMFWYFWQAICDKPYRDAMMQMGASCARTMDELALSILDGKLA